MAPSFNQQIALFFVRIILGLIFFMQGFGKVWTWGVSNVYQMFFDTEQYLVFPKFLLQATAYYTSYVELIAGLLLLLGWKRDYALYALASVLVIVSFGHGFAQPIWDLSHVLYRLFLIIVLLLLPSHWDRFSMDHFLAKK